jgi:hypothetical protein
VPGCCSFISEFLGLGCFYAHTLSDVRSSIFIVEEYVGTRSLRRVIK